MQTLYAREAVLTATSKLQARGFLLRVETGWGPPRPETSLLGTQDGTRSEGAGAQGILAAVRTQIRGLTHLFRAEQRAAHVRGWWRSEGQRHVAHARSHRLAQDSGRPCHCPHFTARRGGPEK